MTWSDYLSLQFTQNVRTISYSLSTADITIPMIRILQVITETLRMGNIIIGVMRKAVRDVEIKGYFIPKGWCTFAYFRSVHLDDSLYECPYKFHPWRWQVRIHSLQAQVVDFCRFILWNIWTNILVLGGHNQDRDSNSSGSFTPFGGGQRLCPGLDLARLEASIFLHHLVTQFR